MSEDDDRCDRCGLPSIECFDYGCPHEPDEYVSPSVETWEQKRNRIHPSRAPARPWRIRVDTGPVGYLWLEWLGACARTAGVAQTAAP